MTAQGSSFKYDAEFNLSDDNNSHALMVKFVGTGRRVLDLGCATGLLGRALRERGCEVVGIERDEGAAAQAAEVLDRVVVADLETADLGGLLGAEAFDVIVCGDVLEHLRDPLRVLRGALCLLAPGGSIVASIPNIAHAAVRLALLAGRFDYRPLGLLDETHVRFFTRRSLQGLLEQAGLVPVEVTRTTAGAFGTEIQIDQAEFSPSLVRSVEAGEEGTTYQFVLRAVRAEEAGGVADDDDIWKTDDRGTQPVGAALWAEEQELSEALVQSVATISRLLPPKPPPAEPDPRYRYGLDVGEDVVAYRSWLQARRRRREQERNRARTVLLTRSGPLISVLVPVYRPYLDLIGRCIESVRNQDYDRWQLCLSDDGSNDPALTAFLKATADSDPRIVATARPVNGGISAATNAAAELAQGQFVAFLDQDDELEPGALAEVAVALTDDPEIDVLYTDEDKIESDGQRSEPFFKPDWAPDQLLSHMYICHLLVVRRALFEEVGRLRSEYDGSQDYDLTLRVTERARRVAHLPTIAYHWRKTEGSTAQDYRAKPGADLAARAALVDALARRGEEATVESGLVESTFRVRRRIKGRPLVSVIIPFHNRAEDLRRCVTSLQETAGYDHWEALLVDNGSWEPEVRAVLARIGLDSRCRVIPYPQVFNWAAINNFAVTQSFGEHVLFLNADVEGRSAGWLEAMLEHSQRPETGAVGARLLYPDGRVQHSGVVMGLGAGVAWHAFCFCPAERGGYFGQAKLIRNYSAVTGACMMVRREVFDRVGGFDAAGLPVAYNDIDFCLRIRQLGYLVVCTPFAELIHAESAARGFSSNELPETSVMFERWDAQIRRDPYFNLHLDPRRSEFTVPAGIREDDPWAKLLTEVETWSSASGTTLLSKRSLLPNR